MADGDELRDWSLWGGSGCSLRQLVEAGLEHQFNSAEKMPLPPGGGAESGALDPDLAVVIDAWPMLSVQCRSKILGLARKALGNGAKRHSG